MKPPRTVPHPPLRITCVAVGLALVAGACDQPDPQPGMPATTPPEATTPEATTPEPPVDRPAARCDMPFRVESGGAFQYDHERLRNGAAKSGGRFPAVTIDRFNHSPVGKTKAYQIDGQPIMWMFENLPFVDAALMSPVAVIAITRMKPGQIAEVGTFTPAARGKLPGREVAKFLMEAHALAVFIHAYANVCFSDERQNEDGSYHARISGEHVYFTNSENHEAVDFQFDIDAGGHITVTSGR